MHKEIGPSQSFGAGLQTARGSRKMAFFEGQYSPGFSLVELLAVVAILAVLLGFIYASTGGVREKARQAVCISHLRQIGQAVAMYRQDYGGVDAAAWPAEMGLPPTHTALLGLHRSDGATYMPGGAGILFCPDHANRGMAASSYGWNVWSRTTRFETGSGAPAPGPSFPEVVARRGGDYPLVYDLNHNRQTPNEASSDSRLCIILRLDGRVELIHTSALQSWEF